MEGVTILPWHLIVGGVGFLSTLLLAWERVHKIVFLPTKQWRAQSKEDHEALEKEHQNLRHEYELFRQRVDGDLKRGDAAFDTLQTKIDKVDETMRIMTQEMIRLRSSLENGLRHAVITGIGDAEHK